MKAFALAFLGLGLAACGSAAQPMAGDEWVTLFNGKDFTGWKLPEGDNGHWKIVDGVIDYDALSEAKAEKHLFSVKEYGDFTLHVEWRIKETPYVNPNVYDIQPDGSHKVGADGKEIKMALPDSDSGIYVRRRDGKSQVNIWCWPVGSGEVYGYRMDKKMPAEVRAGVTPKKKADKAIGEWNAFDITMKGDRLTVVLNGEKVIDGALLPDMPARGPVGLQHHGSKNKEGKWGSPPALVQFRNIKIKEL
ncbi:MAG TPA: DUF1080 domain-containing protein [Planctomycetota bacterium]|nr:DUF1080 domain-containing protein [Planctomycetota bacterium]